MRSGPLHAKFVGEVYPNGNALGALSASDDVVTPLSASVAVLTDRGPSLEFLRKFHAPQEISEINHLNRRRGC